jgi:hypothetical protein
MAFKYVCTAARVFLRLHAVYGTNGNFSEKVFKKQFIPIVLLPLKLEHGHYIFKDKNNFFCHNLLVFPLDLPLDY